MAKTREEKNEAQIETNEVTETKTTSGPSYEELAMLVQQLATEVNNLKNGNSNVTNNTQNTDIASLVQALGNRKSDREVSITHNRELSDGLTTHMELQNISINFSHVGETRLLSWQQFEECASKYRSFFDRRVILISSDYADIAAQYNLPCEERSSTKGRNLTHVDIEKLPTMSVTDLESFVNELLPQDQDTIFSYWLGKCYTREPGFYDRYKMDTLNRLSDGKFTNVLLVMNGDDREEVKKK